MKIGEERKQKLNEKPERKRDDGRRNGRWENFHSRRVEVTIAIKEISM